MKTVRLEKLSLVLSNPEMNFKDMEVSKIMFLVGPNGTGKTLVLVTTWVVQLVAKIFNEQTVNEEILQQIVSGSFDNENISGEITAMFSHGYYLSFTMDKGKVSDVSFTKGESDVSFPTPLFLSKEMRTLSSLIKYRMLRRSGVDLSKAYALYDITYAEMMLEKLKYGILLTEKFHASMKRFEVKKVAKCKEVYYDLEKDDIIFESDDDKVSVKTFSAGEQSLLTIHLAILGTENL